MAEAKRLLGVLDRRLEARAWMMGDDYTIVDISVFPLVRNLIGYYGAGDLVGISNFLQRHRAAPGLRFWRVPAVEKF